MSRRAEADLPRLRVVPSRASTRRRRSRPARRRGRIVTRVDARDAPAGLIVTWQIGQRLRARDLGSVRRGCRHSDTASLRQSSDVDRSPPSAFRATRSSLTDQLPVQTWPRAAPIESLTARNELRAPHALHWLGAARPPAAVVARSSMPLSRRSRSVEATHFDAELLRGDRAPAGTRSRRARCPTMAASSARARLSASVLKFFSAPRGSPLAPIPRSWSQHTAAATQARYPSAPPAWIGVTEQFAPGPLRRPRRGRPSMSR